MSLRFSEEDLLKYQERQRQFSAQVTAGPRREDERNPPRGIPATKSGTPLKTAKSKYRSRKVEIDGIKFDSEKEGQRWRDLSLMEKHGKISNLRRQVSFEIAPAVRLDGRMKPAIRYMADFCYQENGKEVIEDTKSAMTRKLPVFRIKKHLMALKGYEIKEV